MVYHTHNTIFKISSQYIHTNKKKQTNKHNFWINNVVVTSKVKFRSIIHRFFFDHQDHGHHHVSYEDEIIDSVIIIFVVVIFVVLRLSNSAI